MSDPENGYRDELGAAHARIAELEQTLAERTAGQDERVRPFVAKLQVEREMLIAREHAFRGLGAQGVAKLALLAAAGLGLTLIFVLSSPMSGLTPGIIVATLTLTLGVLLARADRQQAPRRAALASAKIDEAIQETKRAVVANDARIRIAAGLDDSAEARVDPTEELEEEDAEPSSRTARRS